MKILRFHISHTLGILIATLAIITPCVSTGVDLVERGEVKVEYEPSHHTHFHRVSARPEKGEVIVSGYLYKRSHHRRSLHRLGHTWGHVDIKVLSSGGDILQQGYTRYTRVGRSKSGKFNLSVRFPDAIPQGSSIRVIHHPDNLRLKSSAVFHPEV